MYDLYKGKVDNYAPPWAIAALDFVRKAQKNGWTLNLILEKHPTNEYIVLCTHKADAYHGTKQIANCPLLLLFVI